MVSVARSYQVSPTAGLAGGVVDVRLRTPPAVMLPLALISPVMYMPVVENTATLLTPPIDTLALPPVVPMLASLLPLNILLELTDIPVS